MKNFLPNFAAGLVVCIIATVLVLLLSPDEIKQMICLGVFCSIVLTLGLVLIIYIPIIYLIGYMALKFINFLTRVKTPTSNGKANPGKEVNAIVYYLRRSKDPVRNIESISGELRNAGWDDKTIDAAYEEFMKKQD
jgi:hypothetical protein